MFYLFAMARVGRRGQLASILVITLVLFIMLAFLTVNLGKIGLARTRLSNAADSAALAASSVASQYFNLLANYNDILFSNFVGFTIQMQLMMLSFLIEWVFTIVTISSAFAVSKTGVPATTTLLGSQAWAQCMGLFFSALSMKLMEEGARKVGDSIVERMDELNSVDKISKNSRNIARSYGFMNAGVDQPKISYNDWLNDNGLEDSEENWIRYLNVETDYAEFMRTLSTDNDADLNYGLGEVSFTWVDARYKNKDNPASQKKVSNTVTVSVVPAQPIVKEVKNFGDVASSSDLRMDLSIKIASSTHTWAISSLAQMGLALAPLLSVFQYFCILLVSIAILIIGLQLTISGVIEVIYLVAAILTLGILGTFPVANAEFIIWAAACLATLTATDAALALIDYTDIPVVFYEGGDNGENMSVSVQLTRTSTGESGDRDVDYGLWKMSQPQSGVTATAKAKAVDGQIFPPSPSFSPMLIEAR